MTKAYIIIPARLSSSRLKRKILLDKTGKYLILHTLEAALKSKLANDVFIATDSKKVLQKILPYYKKVYLTPHTLKSGTDRCLYLARKLDICKNSYIINWQADEPELNAKYVDNLLKILINKQYEIGTLIAPINKRYIDDKNTVKVIINRKNEALFFFRSIPKELTSLTYFHIGLYIYKAHFLEQFSTMKSTLEKSLRLEQMRILENGYKIFTYTIPTFHKGIDVKSDYDIFVKKYGSGNSLI